MSELKTLYHLRWGIETSFRSLKYTVGLAEVIQLCLLYSKIQKAKYLLSAFAF